MHAGICSSRKNDHLSSRDRVVCVSVQVIAISDSEQNCAKKKLDHLALKKLLQKVR